MCEHGTKTTLVFLAADVEAFWSPLPSFVTIRRHNATRKHLLLYPQGVKSGLRKPKKDNHQHQSQLPPDFISLSQFN